MTTAKLLSEYRRRATPICGELPDLVERALEYCRDGPDDTDTGALAAVDSLELAARREQVREWIVKRLSWIEIGNRLGDGDTYSIWSGQPPAAKCCGRGYDYDSALLSALEKVAEWEREK